MWSTFGDFIMKSPWQQKSQDDFILLSLLDSSHNNYHGDFTIESPNDNYMRITRWLYCNVMRGLFKKHHSHWLTSIVTSWCLLKIMRRMKEITVLFTVVIMTLSTICDVKATSHRMVELSRKYLFATLDVSITLFWFLTIYKIGILLPFLNFRAPVYMGNFCKHICFPHLFIKSEDRNFLKNYSRR